MGQYEFLYFLCGVCLLLWLLTKRLFWSAVFGIGGLYATFYTLSSIIHFQIWAAVGMFLVAGFCWLSLYALFESVGAQ